ncbi:RHS repeat protein [Moritella marina ATCC 15381]|uniref:RHS repeat protein n=1 Tax=Moritella marina ATCC 15381 TaxID=1202962 RepID=A0A5J6WK74_MORMI|nr:RHS repeat protein [Moritella marina]QFI38559.1 RHS repeat protein [Moritella marina ATCC 15381]
MIESNASNFSEHINTGVDPRTGSYSFSVNLGEFLSHKTSGPPFSLLLSYNAASSLDMGFGRGWGISLSRFSKSSNTLSLSTGQSFKIEWNASENEYDIPYRKLKDMRVFYLNASKEIKVVYKDGRQDFISYQEGTLSRLVSPQGLVIQFEYGQFKNESVLWRIYDSAGRELTIDWWTNKWQAVVRHSVNATVYQQMIFDKLGGGRDIHLSSITMPEQPSPIEIEYRFVKSSGYDVIEKVTHASGMIEEMTYLDNGHSLPNGAPLSKVPYITEYRNAPGKNQPEQVITYSYSDKNYLGFASDQAWISGEDTLFRARREYQYSSTETINGSQSVVRVYNKYHLLAHAEYRQNGTMYKKEENDYFANLDIGIEYQPATYSFVNEQRTTYYQGGKQKTFSITYNYDDYGNQTYIKQVGRSKITRTFYPASGEGSHCPAEPNGMVSLLKRESFIPASSAHGEVPRHTDMTYLSLPKLNSSNEYFVLIKRQTYHDHSVQMAYCTNKSNHYEYGRLATQKVTVNGKVSTVTYGYDFSTDAVKTTLQLRTHDGLTANTSSTMTYLDGQGTESVNAEGIAMTSTYDAIGRKMTDTVAPGTAYAATVRFSYELGSGINALTTTDAKGNKLVQHFNNAGKEIKVQQSDASGSLKTIRQLFYNNFGLLVTQIDSDWLEGKQLSLTTTYEYDTNGQVNRVTHPDGRIELITQNLATLTIVNELPGLSKEITVYNNAGLEVSKETLDAASNRLAYTQYNYDGYSNLISTTDTNQHVTTQSYDNSDRVVATNKTINGKTVAQSVEYASFTTDALPTNIAVDDINLGQCQYDGLSRMTEGEVAGVNRSASYTGSSMMPSAQTTPHGDTLRFNNNKYHQSPLSVDIAGQLDLAKVFDYDAVTGDITRAQNLSGQQDFSYNQLGQLLSESVQLNDGTKRSATYSYSLQGKLLSKADFFGNNTTYHYDEHARLQTVTSTEGSQTTTTTLTYDAYSRPVSYDTRNGDDVVSINLAFNTTGLETSRTVTINDVEEFTLTQAFNSDLQISEKVYREGGNVTTETMTYDDLHRLVTYVCTGPNAPKDEYGNIIKAQRFNYDVYSNVTQAESNFTDGTTNIATFTYASDNPVQLQDMSNTHSSYPSRSSFNYDAAGNLLADEQGRTYHYNVLEQMESVTEDGQELSRYHYDAMGQVVSQTHEDHLIYLYYQGEKLANELSEGVHTSYQRVGGAAGSRTVQSGNSNQHQFLIPNSQGSILSTLSTSETTDERVQANRQYTPYGEG